MVRLHGGSDGFTLRDLSTTVSVEAYGGDGDDALFSDWGDDVLVGGAGNDVFSPNVGYDYVDGGPGDDWLMHQGFAFSQHVGFGDADTFIGGAGRDHMDYRYASARVRVDLDDVADDGRSGEGDNVRSDVEDLTGAFNHSGNELYGNDGPNTIRDAGPGGRVFGRGGNDVLSASTIDGVVDGGTGTDSCVGATLISCNEPYEPVRSR